MNVLNFSSLKCMINMNKKSVMYLQGINFSQLTLAEKTETKNLGHATHDVIISQSLSRRKETCENTWPCYIC